MRITRWLAALTVVCSVAALSACAPPTNVTVNGHGWGHGRGMGQYGALGYAVDHGWDTWRILDQYYGGTVNQFHPYDPLQRVFLRSSEGQETIAYSESGTLTMSVDGYAGNYRAIRVGYVDANRFRVFTGPGCGGPWTEFGAAVYTAAEITIAPRYATNDRTQMAERCEAGGSRAYRGKLIASHARGSMATVNEVDTESLVRSVITREISASWADLSGGRGFQAVQAQAVASRSYALAGDGRWGSFATTCDDTYCQAYPGVAYVAKSGAVTTYEDPRTDQAVVKTSLIKRQFPNGATAATEFSSSTGGWTAGGAFPAAPDDGDAYAGNPNHNWSVTYSAASIESAFDRRQGRDMGQLLGIDVNQRDGHGAEGGRVLAMTVHFANGDVSLSGDSFRSLLGLKSNWFSFALS